MTLVIPKKDSVHMAVYGRLKSSAFVGLFDDAIHGIYASCFVNVEASEQWLAEEFTLECYVYKT